MLKKYIFNELSVFKSRMMMMLLLEIKYYIYLLTKNVVYMCFYDKILISSLNLVLITLLVILLDRV